MEHRKVGISDLTMIDSSKNNNRFHHQHHRTKKRTSKHQQVIPLSLEKNSPVKSVTYTDPNANLMTSHPTEQLLFSWRKRWSKWFSSCGSERLIPIKSKPISIFIEVSDDFFLFLKFNTCCFELIDCLLFFYTYLLSEGRDQVLVRETTILFDVRWSPRRTIPRSNQFIKKQKKSDCSNESLNIISIDQMRKFFLSQLINKEVVEIVHLINLICKDTWEDYFQLSGICNIEGFLLLTQWNLVDFIESILSRISPHVRSDLFLPIHLFLIISSIDYINDERRKTHLTISNQSTNSFPMSFIWPLFTYVEQRWSFRHTWQIHWTLEYWIDMRDERVFFILDLIPWLEKEGKKIPEPILLMKSKSDWKIIMLLNIFWPLIW